ncbi:MAG: hypothetical protein ACR2O4_02690 [Hyphomicrobiaceae bacterium]
MNRLHIACAATAIAAAALSTGVQAAQINTGGETGAYYSRFCPLLKDALANSRFKYECATSAGSRENMQRTISDPTDIGFAQRDIYALERTMLGEELFTTLRDDGARECLFMVARNPDFTNYGQITGAASKLRFILPPEKSGSAASFEFLRQIDPDGLGLAREVTYADSTDEAIEKALSADDTVTLFVQYPDPANPRFKQIDKRGGQLIPVLDRNILRQQVSGEKIYFAQATDIVNPKWSKTTKEFVTSCTPLVVFTGTPERLTDKKAREDHADLVRTVKDMPTNVLRPKTGGGFFSNLWRKTKKLSGESMEQLLELSDEAREKAGPMMERAKEASRDALERAGELAEDSLDRTKDLIDKAREKAEDFQNDDKDW